jgi:hypothetical protein
MLVLIKYRKCNGAEDGVMIDVEKPEDIEAAFFNSAEPNSKMIWYLPKCGSKTWRKKF